MFHRLIAAIAAGLVLTPGAALAEPPAKGIKKCATLDQPGPYVLADNIVADMSPCIKIVAPGVVLDLAGHTIDAPPGVQAIEVSTGIDEPEAVVRNGRIRGATAGVLVQLGDASRAEHLFIRNDGPVGGTALEVGDRSIVRENIIQDLGDTGLRVVCPTVVLHNVILGQMTPVAFTGISCAFDSNAIAP